MYEAPKITKVGSLRDLTLGESQPLQFNDDSYFWGATPTKGSR
jgi:hypothetical protein